MTSYEQLIKKLAHRAESAAAQLIHQQEQTRRATEAGITADPAITNTEKATGFLSKELVESMSRLATEGATQRLHSLISPHTGTVRLFSNSELSDLPSVIFDPLDQPTNHRIGFGQAYHSQPYTCVITLAHKVRFWGHISRLDVRQVVGSAIVDMRPPAMRSDGERGTDVCISWRDETSGTFASLYNGKRPWLGAINGSKSVLRASRKAPHNPLLAHLAARSAALLADNGWEVRAEVSIIEIASTLASGRMSAWIIQAQALPANHLLALISLVLGMGGEVGLHRAAPYTDGENKRLKMHGKDVLERLNRQTLVTNTPEFNEETGDKYDIILANDSRLLDDMERNIVEWKIEH